MIRSRASKVVRFAQLVALAFVVWMSGACASSPTMKLNHASVSGMRIAFPPSVGVLMTVYIDVYNPNSYDVAVRAVRGQVLLANRYSLPVNFQATGDGVWLASNATTQMAVPVEIPVQTGLAVVRESMASPTIPFHFQGKADVTATRTFQIEKDDYSVSESGTISRQQIEAVVGR